MAKLIKHSATPLLVIEGSKVTLASRSAQRLLGKHIIGQDVRMAFRQPQAIKLLNKQKSGLAIIKGLAAKGYEGWFVIEAEQDPVLNPPLKMAKKGRAELYRLMDKAGYEVVT